LKNKGFKEERMTKVGGYAIDTFTTLESNKSLSKIPFFFLHAELLAQSLCPPPTKHLWSSAPVEETGYVPHVKIRTGAVVARRCRLPRGFAFGYRQAVALRKARSSALPF
jgi:hypothetical protein